MVGPGRHFATQLYVTINVTTKPVTVLHETNHGCIVVSYTCSCKTLVVSRQ